VGEKSKEISQVINYTFISKLEGKWKSKGIYKVLGLDENFYESNINLGYSIFYKGYSSWGVTMTLWTLKFSKQHFTDYIDPDENIQEVKLNWSLSKLEKGLLDFTDYCSSVGIFKAENSELPWLTDATYATKIGFNAANDFVLKPMDANLPRRGFFVKDACFTGDPYSEIEGCEQIYRYKDN